MSEAMTRPSVVPLIWYARPRAAIAWLERAIGFETVMIVGDGDDDVIHSELTFADGAVYVVGPPGRGHSDGATPAQLGGRGTQSVCMNLTHGLDALCERARAAGATIVREPADQPYGDRVFALTDPEGHSWSFAQPAKTMTMQEMAAATGRKIEGKDTSHG